MSLLRYRQGQGRPGCDRVAEESTVVGWFSNHQYPLAKLREATKSMLGKACELVKAGATRFGTHTLV